MAGSEAAALNQLALLVLGLHVSVLGLAIDQLVIVVLGFMLSLVVYFVNFW